MVMTILAINDNKNILLIKAFIIKKMELLEINRKKNSFLEDRFKMIIQEETEKLLKDAIYDEKNNKTLCDSLISNILTKIQAFDSDKHKFLTHALITSAENTDFNCLSLNMWDEDSDSYIVHDYTNGAIRLVFTLFIVL